MGLALKCNIFQRLSDRRPQITQPSTTRTDSHDGRLLLLRLELFEFKVKDKRDRTLRYHCSC